MIIDNKFTRKRSLVVFVDLDHERRRIFNIE